MTSDPKSKAMLSKFSTAGLPKSSRARLVQSFVKDCYGPSFLWEPINEDTFSVDMSVRHFGDAIVVRHLSSAFMQRSIPTPPSWPKRRFALHAALGEDQVLEMGGQSLRLHDGEFVLLDVAAGCARNQLTPAETLVFAVPEASIRRHVPNVEALLGERFSRENSLCAAISNILRSASELEESQAAEIVGSRLTGTLLDLLGILAECRAKPRQSSGAESLAVKAAAARRHVDDLLADPELSVTSVAAALGVSTRYLHLMFAQEPESLPEYIRKRRLEACSEQLRNEAWRDKSISEIAFNWGFNDLSHFCRLFRQQFGMPARDYRKAMFQDD